MTSPRSPDVSNMDKSLVVNMLKFEATTKDSHLPPITRSVVEEMVHRNEAKIRSKPAIRAVPDSVKIYRKMKKRGIFTMGISADSKIEDNSFKIETKGFNLSNIPDNLTYTCAKHADKDGVWVEVKRNRARKSGPFSQDDGFSWPKFTRNHTMILPKLSYGVENVKQMKTLVPTEVESNPKDGPSLGPTASQEAGNVAPEPAPTATSSAANLDATDSKSQTEIAKDGGKGSAVTVSLISIGQDQKQQEPNGEKKNESEDVTKQSSGTMETPRPGPVLRQVTIGVDIPDPNPDAKRKKEIRAMYPMYDSIEDKKEKQRQNWWEKPRRSPTHAQKQNANNGTLRPNHHNAIFLAPIPKPYQGVVENNKADSTSEKSKIIIANKDYVMADEMERNALRNKGNKEDYLNMPGVFEKHLEVVKTIAQSRGGLVARSPSDAKQVDLTPRVTSLTPGPKMAPVSTPNVPSVPPPSAATAMLAEEITFHKMDTTMTDMTEGRDSVPGSVDPSGVASESVARVEIAISDDKPQEADAGGDDGSPGGLAIGVALTVDSGPGDASTHGSDGQPHQLSQRESLSAISNHSGRGDDDRPSGPIRRKSSFLELPPSPRDPGERPPSGEKDSKTTGSPALGTADDTGDHQPLRRRTSSFLEPPGSQCDPLERPPSKSDTVDFNPEEDNVFGDQSPRLSRHPTPEILVSLEAEKLVVPNVGDSEKPEETGPTEG